MYRLTRLSLAYPRSVLLILAAITLILAAGLPRLRTEFGYRVLVGDEHPAMRTLDDFIETFGGAVPASIVWECGPALPCESALDATSLKMANSITEELQELEFVKKVTGVSNAPLLVPTTEGFAVRRFVKDGVVVGDAAALSVHAREDPLWVGTLVSPDALVGAITVQPVDNDSSTDLRLVDVLEKVVASKRAKGFDLALVGDSVAGVISGRELAQSTARIIPITVLVIGLIVMVLTRSWRFALLSLTTMGVSLVWTFGALAWMNWPRDGILEVLAPLLLTVGICDAVHLLSRYASEFADREGSSMRVRKYEAMLNASRDVAPACVLTTLTTGAALASFATSRLETFVRFGAISAFGVLVCLLLTFTFLPAIAIRLSVDRLRVKVHSSWNTALNGLMRLTDRRRIPILVTAFAVMGASAVAWATLLKVDSDFIEIFGEQSLVMRWTKFVESRLRPSDNLEIEIVLDPSTRIEDPQTLKKVSDFAQFLSGVDGLGAARSVVDLVSRVNRLLHDDDPTFERIADTGAGNAEILELLSFDGPDVLGDWLTLDRRKLRISVNGAEQAYSSREYVLNEAQRWVDRNLPQSWSVRFTGEMAIMVDWIKDVQGTQLRSFPTAFGLVMIMIAFFLRSFPLALVAIVPTVLPVVALLGAMGWMGMTLDVGRAMIAAVVIGIGVDDAIHLLSRYKVHRVAGDNPRQAMRRAVLHVGRAVVTTSVALALGFLTLMASAWQTISSFGFFVALAILGALAATLFVLPAMIFAWEYRDRLARGLSCIGLVRRVRSRSRRAEQRGFAGSHLPEDRSCTATNVLDRPKKRREPLGRA